jgi:hypothetical protein
MTTQTDEAQFKKLKAENKAMREALEEISTFERLKDGAWKLSWEAERARETLAKINRTNGAKDE